MTWKLVSNGNLWPSLSDETLGGREGQDSNTYKPQFSESEGTKGKSWSAVSDGPASLRVAWWNCFHIEGHLPASYVLDPLLHVVTMPLHSHPDSSVHGMNLSLSAPGF